MLRSNRIEARYRALLNNYTEEMKRRRQAVIAKTDELQIADVGKKLKSQLFLILSKEGWKCVARKNPGRKILDINNFRHRDNIPYQQI